MKLRVTIRSLVPGILAIIFAAVSSDARGAYVLTLQQTAGNVVATGSGSFNLAALTINDAGDIGVAANFFPSLAQAVVGVPATATDLYQGISGSADFGSGSSIEFANSSGGNVSGVDDAQILFVPAGYTSGTFLSGSATWTDATYSSLGITPGTYSWTWGSGATADSFTMDISTGAVPEPSTWAMLVAGVGMLMGFRARRAK
jgi:hypothetical protein